MRSFSRSIQALGLYQKVSWTRSYVATHELSCAESRSSLTISLGVSKSLGFHVIIDLQSIRGILDRMLMRSAFVALIKITDTLEG